MKKKFNLNIKTLLKLPLILVSKIILIVKLNLKNEVSYKYIYKKYEKQKLDECYEYFKNHFNNSLLIDQISQIRIFSIKTAINEGNKDGSYFEFGVYDGESINLFSKYLKDKKIYGFDSFEGLKDNWTGHSLLAGTFNREGKIPKLDSNAIAIKGWVQETLPKFLIEKKISYISFLHMDLDTYESTKFVLEKLKVYFRPGTVILFDQLYNYPGWQQGEFKALNEVLKESEYKYLAFGKHSKQAAIKIL